MADILVVDDEENLCYSIRLALQRAGHTCRTAETAGDAMAECHRQMPDLAIIDIQLPDSDGIELTRQLRDQGADFPIIIITAYGTVDTAVAAMKQGAHDFVQKPISMEELQLVVHRCLEDRDLRNQLDAYRESQRRGAQELQIIGQCERMREVLALADRIGTVPGDPGTGLVTTLLLGQTGTGKEIIARYIHARSPKPDQPFVQVNCTAVPENLFESELFGHERGAYTDAKTAKKGLLEMAHGGTLFLDEIGHMPAATQAKLLVAIETGRFRRLGATTERVVDVRVLAATNTHLEAQVQRGEFRPDLFYRLKMFCIQLPPLRERGDDVFLLADHFILRFCRKFNKLPMSLSDEARDVMRRYAWPGNVRELANVLQRAVLVNDSSILTPEVIGIQADRSGPRPASPTHPFDFDHDDCTLAAVEARLIKAALQRAGGNVSETARLLGLSRGALRHRMEKLGLDAEISSRSPG
jgi:DNA-binding NtrC family response regulator